jgi:hypothetical protein
MHYHSLREHFHRPLAAEMLMRKFGTWYASGLRDAASIRRRFQGISSEADLEAVLEEMLEAGTMDGLPDPSLPSDTAVRSGIVTEEMPCGG